MAKAITVLPSKKKSCLVLSVKSEPFRSKRDKTVGMVLKLRKWLHWRSLSTKRAGNIHLNDYVIDFTHQIQ